MANLLSECLKRLGYVWYLVNPKDHMFNNVEDVPDYYKEIAPAYIFMITLEQVISAIQRKKIMRLNDTVTNICQGLLMELFKIPLHGVELILYTWIYNNFRICTLPWNSVGVWLFCMIASDFCFYWMHRATHQVSILWSFHETHHSSEEYNLTVPLRLNIFTTAGFWLTYVPLAFIIPPSVYLVHYQLVILFQFWLHTELVKSLGVIEYVFVTPSHHRVHHGRNRRCIDKNFGSIFIIWDRMFGTFEPEGTEKIYFGVTKPLKTFSPITVQLNHLQTIWGRLITADSFLDRIFYIIKGPGWTPGKPWMGNVEDIPEPKGKVQKYNPKLSWFLQVYVLIHTAAFVIGHFQMMLNLPMVPTFVLIVCSFYIIFTTIALSAILDISPWAYPLELLRCLLYFIVDATLQQAYSNHNAWVNVTMFCFRYLFFSSLIFWICAFPLLNYTFMKKRV